MDLGLSLFSGLPFDLANTLMVTAKLDYVPGLGDFYARFIYCFANGGSLPAFVALRKSPAKSGA